MTARNDYQSYRFDPHPTQRMVDACCARIAELEAELAALKAQVEAACASPAGCPEQAELAALKTRRCWTCKGHVYLSHGGNAYRNDTSITCPMFGREFEADGYCHRWAARDEA